MKAQGARRDRRAPAARLGLLWLGGSLLIAALGLFGIAYPFFAIWALAFCLGVWVASEARWRQLRGALSARADEGESEAWSPRYAIFLIVHGLFWLGLGILFLLFANYSVVGEIT